LNVVNITHGEDPDGLSCAAFLSHLKNAEIIPANYDNFEDALQSIQPPLDELYITDLNIRRALVDEILRIKRFSKVIVIDHHSFAEDVRTILEDEDILLIHDLSECAGVLLYNHFKEQLPKKAAKLAAYAAISDMFEEGPIASKILAHMDRKLTQHEALMLTHAMQHNGTQDFRSRILEELSKFNYPHRIQGVKEASNMYLENATKMIESLRDETEVIGRCGVLECSGDTSTGATANLVMDSLGVDVGVCYKHKEGSVNISLRGEKYLKEHLGEISHKLAERFGGFGGGHKRAAGAKIPQERIGDYVKALSEILGP
jgi:RecJ-like exonuclease